MRFRLGDIELLAPARWHIGSSQKVGVLEVPFGEDAVTNNGAGAKSFEWEGVISAAEGGVDKAMELDTAKAEEETLTLGIGGNSWDVVIERFDFSGLRGDHIEYQLAMREVQELVAIISVPQAEIAAVDKTAEIIARLEAQQTAFSWRGIQNRIYDAMVAVIAGIARVSEMTRELRRLTELPASSLAALKATLGIVLAQLDGMIELIRPQVGEEQLYREGDELLLSVLLEVRRARREMGTLAQAVNMTPAGEQRYVVCGEDTLMGIATRFYGTRAGWDRIAAANRIWRPEELEAGREIVIPGRN